MILQDDSLMSKKPTRAVGRTTISTGALKPGQLQAPRASLMLPLAQFPGLMPQPVAGGLLHDKMQHVPLHHKPL